MRRAFATFLVAVFSFALIAPVLLANTDSNLPACCRRGGQHRCAMSNMADQSSGTGMRAVQPTCPLFPKASAAGVSFESGLPGSSAQIGALILLRSANRQTSENVPQIALRGSTRKRGPPSNLD
jgi:hypothetical protein